MRRVFVSFVFLYTFFAIHSAYALQLQDLVEIALKNDPKYKKQLSETKARKWLGWQARVNYGPTLTGNIRYGYNRETSENLGRENSDIKGATATDKDTNSYQKEFLLSLTQPIINFEKLYLSKWGKAEVSAADIQQKQVREELVLQVCEQYFSFLISQANYQLAMKESKSLEQQLKDIQSRLFLGFATITDLQNAQSRYSLSLATSKEKKIEYDSSRKRLEEVVGTDLDERIEDVAGDISTLKPRKTLAYWQDITLLCNSEYLLAEISCDAEQRKLQAVKGRYLPVLNFFAEYNKNESDVTSVDYDKTREESIVGLKLQMDIFSSGRDIYGTLAASEQVKAAQKNKESVKLHILSQLNMLWLEMNDTVELIKLYEEAEKSSNDFMHSTKNGYLEGMYSLLDVLNSQREYFRVVSQLKSARYNYLTLQQQFKKTVGINDIVQLNFADEKESL